MINKFATLHFLILCLLSILYENDNVLDLENMIILTFNSFINSLSYSLNVNVDFYSSMNILMFKCTTLLKIEYYLIVL